MDTQTVRRLRGAAAALIFVTAAYHLWWGFPRSLVYLNAAGSLRANGLPPDPRPFLFVALALALLIGPYFVTRRIVPIEHIYLAGIVLLVGSILAWIGWHTTGHGAFLIDGLSAPAADDGHTHGTQNTVLLILDHFDTEPTETAIKAVEAVAAAILGVLRFRDPDVVADS
jgi:hypothetical protein